TTTQSSSSAKAATSASIRPKHHPRASNNAALSAISTRSVSEAEQRTGSASLTLFEFVQKAESGKRRTEGGCPALALRACVDAPSTIPARSASVGSAAIAVHLAG